MSLPRRGAPVPRGQGSRGSDAGLFAASGQELASVVNSPAEAAAPWYAWAFPGTGEDYNAPPPPLPPGTLPEVRVWAGRRAAGGRREGAAVPCSSSAATPAADTGTSCDLSPACYAAQVSIHDFDRYLRLVGDRFEVFDRDRASSQERIQQALTPGAHGGRRSSAG